MTFAAPLFLLAALAAAIPVVLHLMNRRRAKEMPFPTLRFLQVSVRKTRRKKRIQDILLMLLRAALLLLLAAGLARPTLVGLGSFWGGANSAVVIVLDNSTSMGRIDHDRVRLDSGVAASLQILDQLADGDQVALLPACGPKTPDAERLDRTQDAVRQALSHCRVTYECPDLDAKLRQARAMLEKSEAVNKSIYVITDMQRTAWETQDGETRRRGDEETSQQRRKQKSPSLPVSQSSRLSTPVPLIVINCNRSPKPNVAVQSVALDAAMPTVGVPIKIIATLQNMSAVAEQRLVALFIDGQKTAESSELILPASGTAKCEFSYTPQSGGLHRGEVRLVGADGCAYDDRRWFVVEVDRGVPVAVVKFRQHEIAYLDDAYYLQNALASGRADAGAIAATSLLAADLAAESLEKYKVVYCVNLPALDDEAARRLGDYVAGGGRVVWICGDAVQPDAYNRMNEAAGGRLLPAALVDVRSIDAKSGKRRDCWHVSYLDRQYPAFARLAEPASLYESVLVYKHVRLAAGDNQAGVLMRLDDGEPLFMQKPIEKGVVLLFGSGVQQGWSNLPRRPIFLPLVAQLTLHLADAAPTQTDAIAGRPISLPLLTSEKTDAPANVEVVSPNGERLRVKAEEQGKPVRTFRYADTHEIGVYTLRQLDATLPKTAAYAVNFDPREADPAEIDRKDLESHWPFGPTVFSDNPDDLAETFQRLREGQSLWAWFLAAVLVGLVFETFLSNRFGAMQENENKK
jgi:hypothetical protein